jgi:hypothetical protein
MASSAWAFVRPFEIDKGIQMAVATKDAEQKNEIALAEAQANLEQNSLLRPIQLEQQRQVADHNAALRPIQLAVAQTGLDQQTYQAIDSQIAFNAGQIFRNINITPGESEDSVLMKYLEAIKGVTEPAVKNAMVQQINGMASGLSIKALNRGDPVAAQNVRTLMGDAIQSQSLVGLPPAQQYAIASNTQLTSQLPNPAIQLEAFKQQNALGLKAAVSGDAVIRETNDMAGKSIIPMSTLAQEYTKMIMEERKTGLPMSMTFEQYAAQFQGNRAQSINSVIARPTPGVSPTGVPYK